MRLTKTLPSRPPWRDRSPAKPSPAASPRSCRRPSPSSSSSPTAPRSTFGILLPLALLGGLVALAVASEDDDESDRRRRQLMPNCRARPDAVATVQGRSSGPPCFIHGTAS